MPRKKPINKTTLGVQARYDAAGTGRRMRGWNPPTSGPNRALVGLQKIRDRARDVSRNDWSGKSSSQKWTTNLIGIGIKPRLTRVKSATRKLELIDLWNDWTEFADADGVLTFYGQQTLATRTWLDAGEVFIRKRVRSANFGMAVPLQVQLIEPEFVPLFDADVWPGMPRGNRIRSGIELDNRNQRVAYWVYRDHPGDGTTNITADRQLRIPAAEIIHMYEPERPGALRGVSALAAVLARLRNIEDYDDAVLERQKLANLFTLFITQQAGGEDSVDPMTGLPYEFDGNTPLLGLQPGMAQELAPGQDVKFSNPPEAGTTYSDYMRTQHLGTAAASGMPYEVFSGDIREISDRTLRVLINEFRRFAEQRQWQIIIPMMCQRVRAWWAEAAILGGQVSLAEADDVRRVEWSTHGWAYIHPVQDPQGKALEVESGFRSRSSVIGERGDDPEMVDAERAVDSEREKKLGLHADPTGQNDANGNPVVPPEPADPNQDPADPEADKPDEEAKARIALVYAQTKALLREPTPQPAPVVNATFNLPPPVNNFNATVEPPVNNIHTTVEAPINNFSTTVEPTPVVVNNIGPNKSVAVAVRDDDGNILRTETTHEME